MPTSDEEDFIPGWDQIARSVGERPRPAIVRKARRRVPSRRVLTSGGMLLRIAAYFVTLAGGWFFIWALIKTWLIVGGMETQHAARIRYADEQLMLEAKGWPEVILLVILAVGIWCVATVTFALGHALYAVRDLAFSKSTHESAG